MIDITGYKQVNYTDFQKALHLKYTDSEKTPVEVAAGIKVKSPATIKNAFKTDMQIVSDEVLTAVMKSVGLSGFVIWVFGKKYYYIKNK